jgi:2'-5' RNA ligase
MPAHITLIYPFTDDSVLTADRIREARDVLGRFAPFPFQLGSVGWFRNEAESHVYLAPEPARKLLRRAHHILRELGDAALCPAT